MTKLNIADVDVASKRVLTRVDFNVPLNDDGTIADDRRIRAALPTIRSIVDRKGRCVLMSHLGRPSGEGYEQSLSLKPVADHLATLLSTKVSFPSQDCVDKAAFDAVNAMKDGEIVVLENLRFHAGEKANDSAFAAQLATMGDLYCSDAFGTAHRKDASMVALPIAMSAAPRAAGLLMAGEIKYLSQSLEDPKRPYVVVLGGAKVSDKLNTIRKLLETADMIFVGGAMAYTFLEVLGRRMGDSRVESDRLDDAKEIIELAAEKKAELFFPNDHVAGKEISEQSPVQVFVDHIDDDWMGLDIGPDTQKRYASRISTASTIVWNGPMGVFEVPPFNVGTEVIASAVAQATKKGATTIIGGGDTAAAIHEMKLDKTFSHVSTGGGATLVMLEGGDMPGIEALSDA